MSATADYMDRIAARDGQIVRFGVDFQTFGALAFGAAAPGSANYGATGRGGIDFLAQEVGRRHTRY